MHYWADLQSVHWFRCYDNTHVCKLIALYTANAYSAERELSVSACIRCMPGQIIFVKHIPCCLGLVNVTFNNSVGSARPSGDHPCRHHSRRQTYPIHRSRIRYLGKKNSRMLTNFPKLKKFVKCPSVGLNLMRFKVSS